MSITVVLADDHTVVRDGLKAFLEAESNIHVIGTAANGRKAIRLVQKLSPDLVIMDIAMPELNGIEATRQILERCPGTQVIILSMHDSKEHIYRALQAGARGYLLKESAGQEVVEAVRAVCAGNRYLSRRITDSLIDSYLFHRQVVSGQSPLEQLSFREREVLQLVVEGKTSAQIAKDLFLSPKTIETYRSRIMQKLNVKDLPGLVKFAIRHGLTSIEI